MKRIFLIIFILLFSSFSTASLFKEGSTMLIGDDAILWNDIVDSKTSNVIFSSVNTTGNILVSSNIANTDAVSISNGVLGDSALYIGQSSASNWAIEVATNQYGLFLTNNGATGRSLVLDHNSNGTALDIDSENTGSTGAHDVKIDSAMTSGNSVYIYSNAVRTAGNSLLLVQDDNSAHGGDTISVINDGTGRSLYIDQNTIVGGYLAAVHVNVDAANTSGLLITNTQPINSDYYGQLYIKHGDGAINSTTGTLRGSIVIQENGGTGSTMEGIQYYNSRGNGAKAINIEMASASNTGHAIEIDNEGSGLDISLVDVGTGIRCGAGDYGFYRNSTSIYACKNGVVKDLFE